MNVMVVDRHPWEAARMLPDQHVVKLALESAQIMCTVADWHGLWHQDLYKPTHRSHPVVIKARDDERALRWLFNHGMALCREHRWRYANVKAHLTTEARIMGAARAMGISVRGWEGAPVALAMDDEFKKECPVESYRAWICHKVRLWHGKGRPARYTRRRAPMWLGPNLLMVQELRGKEFE